MAPIIKNKSGKTGQELTGMSSGRPINTIKMPPKPANAGSSSSSRSPGHVRQGSLTLFVPPLSDSKKSSNLMKGTPKPVPTKTGRFYTTPVKDTTPTARFYTTPVKNTTPTFYTTPVKDTTETRKSKFGILWLPITKRNKNKNVVYNSYGNLNTYRERAPSMYNMHGDSTESRQAKKDEDSSFIPLENIKAEKQVTPVASVSTATDTSDVISSFEEIQLDNKPTKLETEDTDKKIGDNEEQKFLDNKDDDEKSQKDMAVAKRKGIKDLDKVDGVKFSQAGNYENEQEADCGTTCLNYTMQLCECVII